MTKGHPRSHRVSKLTQPPQNTFHETIFVIYEAFPKPESVYSVNVQRTEGVRMGSMFEFVIAVIALSSASIFLAHAIEAYLTP